MGAAAHLAAGTRVGGQAGGIALRLLDPEMVRYTGLLQLAPQSPQLWLPFHLQHHLPPPPLQDLAVACFKTRWLARSYHSVYFTHSGHCVWAKDPQNARKTRTADIQVQYAIGVDSRVRKLAPSTSAISCRCGLHSFENIITRTVHAVPNGPVWHIWTESKSKKCVDQIDVLDNKIVITRISSKIAWAARCCKVWMALQSSIGCKGHDLSGSAPSSCCPGSLGRNTAALRLTDGPPTELRSMHGTPAPPLLPRWALLTCAKSITLS